MSLMEYIETPKPERPQHGADKYFGAIAEGYDAKRAESPKWIFEQAVIESMLDDLPSGDIVFDCPAGTGRFLPYCQKRKLIYIAADKSEDMLRQATQKVVNPETVRFLIADVRKLAIDDKQVDASIMCRLTRWLSPPECVLALHELQRVSRKKIISTWRVRDHIHARSYDLIKSALNGWQIARDEGLPGDEAYRVIELRPV